MMLAVVHERHVSGEAASSSEEIEPVALSIQF